MKKIILIFSVIVLVIVIVSLIFFLKLSVNNEENNEKDNLKNNSSSESNSGLANPASVFCLENKGTLEIRENENGQYGVCIKDEKECEEWLYYQGECML